MEKNGAAEKEEHKGEGKKASSQSEAEIEAEIERLKLLVAQQRIIIDKQKSTISELMNESAPKDEIARLRASLAAKSPLLHSIASESETEAGAITQLRAENASLKRQIEQAEINHMSEVRALKAQLALLSARTMPKDGCAVCKRKIRELEARLKEESNGAKPLQA